MCLETVFDTDIQPDDIFQFERVNNVFNPQNVVQA